MPHFLGENYVERSIIYDEDAMASSERTDKATDATAAADAHEEALIRT